MAKLGCDAIEDRVNEENWKLAQASENGPLHFSRWPLMGQSLPTIGRVEETFCGSK